MSDEFTLTKALNIVQEINRKNNIFSILWKMNIKVYSYNFSFIKSS
jgi:hypothetical protein